MPIVTKDSKTILEETRDFFLREDIGQCRGSYKILPNRVHHNGAIVPYTCYCLIGGIAKVCGFSVYSAGTNHHLRNIILAEPCVASAIIMLGLQVCHGSIKFGCDANHSQKDLYLNVLYYSDGGYTRPSDTSELVKLINAVLEQL